MVKERHLGMIVLVLVAFFLLPTLAGAASDDFIIKVDTTKPGNTDNKSIRLPLQGGPYTIKWGDGNHETTGGAITQIDHTYADGGEYVIIVDCSSAAAPQIKYANGNDKHKLLEIQQWGTAQWASMSHAFEGCNNMIMTATDTPDLSKVTDMSYMFSSAWSFNQDIGNWNVSNVTNMSDMFFFAGSFNQDIGDWDVSNVTDMRWMFCHAKVFDQAIGNWKVLKVTNMSAMFANATAFNHDIDNWDVSNVTDMNSMFCCATAFNQDIGGWDVSNVTDMSWMLSDKRLSTANYDALLIGWSKLSLQHNVTLNAPDCYYSPGTAASREHITSRYIWTILDNGPAPYLLTVVSGSGTHYLPKGEVVSIVADSPQSGYHFFSWSSDNGGTFDNVNASTTNFTMPGNDVTVTAHFVSNASDFIVKVDTTKFGDTNNKSIRLPLIGGPYTIDWDNDGSYDETATTDNAAPYVDHHYATGGEYTIRIYCDNAAAPQIQYEYGNDNHKLLEIKQWGTAQWASMSHAFDGCNNMTMTATDTPDLSKVTDMSYMFDSASKFNGNISGWDVSKVTNMELMFYNATVFNQDIHTWDVSKVTNMKYMFTHATAFNQDIGGWNVSKVTDMSYMFNEATAFNQDISSWNVSNVTDMNHMFTQATAFNQDIGGWDVSNVTNMLRMFSGASSFNQDIGGWNVSKVTDMGFMFYGASSFNQNIGGWDVSNVKAMEDMFRDASSFNQDIGSWKVSNVTDMTAMFSGASSFNQDIGNWKVSNVTNMSGMFNHATSFNQDIGNWDVSKVILMGGMFSQATSFNQNIGHWNVSYVTEMTMMFYQATSFNQNLGNWDVSQVKHMGLMLTDVHLSTANYDALLTGWSNLPSLQPWVTFDAPECYHSPGTVASKRQDIIDNYGWYITDHGLAPYLLTVVNGSGTHYLPAGEVVSIVADTKTGYHFTNWSSNNGGTFADANASTTNFTMPANNVTGTANYAINTYTVTAKSAGNGTVSPATQSVNYGASSAAITASPATGYHFTSWDDGNTDNPRTLTNVTADQTITASFALNQKVTIAAATGNGNIILETNCPGGGFHHVSAKTEPDAANDQDYDYPYGLVEFSLNCTQADVTITFPGDVSDMAYRKYGPKTPGNTSTTQWYTFTNIEISGNQVTLHLRDGEIGDDTGTDGVIVDQGGPGQHMAVPTMTEWGTIILMVLIGFVAVFFLRNKRIQEGA